MLLPFKNIQPLSLGLRAGGKWLNWAKSTPAQPIWETPFAAADHLRPCKADRDFPELQEVDIDDYALYSADSLETFADGKLADVVPIPPGVIGPDGPHSVLGDASFEQVQVAAGQFLYRPTGSPWTFAGNAGISAGRSNFTLGAPAAPDGAQVAVLQATGSFSQTVAGWTIGTYLLTFSATQRTSNQKARQDFSVLVDGVVVGTFTPLAGLYQRYATSTFPITAGSHVVTFQGLNTAGGDNTAFVDSIQQFMVG